MNKIHLRRLVCIKIITTEINLIVLWKSALLREQQALSALTW
jgi:hypothetical protein